MGHPRRSDDRRRRAELDDLIADLRARGATQKDEDFLALVVVERRTLADPDAGAPHFVLARAERPRGDADQIVPVVLVVREARVRDHDGVTGRRVRRGLRLNVSGRGVCGVVLSFRGHGDTFVR